MRATLGFFAFFLLFTGTYIGLHYVVALWLLRHFPSLPAAPVRTGFLIAALSLPLSMLLLRRSPSETAAICEFLAYVWMGIIFVWFWAALGGIIGEWAAGFFADKSLVRLWGGRAVIAATAVSLIYAAYSAYREPAIVRVEIPMKNLPPELDGFTIALVADLHLGASVPHSRILTVCKQLAAAKPDMLVVDGDFVDPGFHDAAMLAKASALVNFPAGKFGVFGNHEFYYGLDKSAAMYGAFGLATLRDKIVQLPNGLQLAGVDDVRSARITASGVDNLLSRLDPAKPSVFLSHQPLNFEVAANLGVGLMLSGHTHNGQIFPFNFFVKLTYPRIYGMYREGSSCLCVTSGAGWWGPPLRLFTRCEIPLITLRFVPPQKKPI
jgi:hypothetical protein